MKPVKIEVTMFDFQGSNSEIISVNVPEGLSKEDEDKFIDEQVEDYKFSNGY